MDSDRPKKGAKMNAAKLRVRKERLVLSIRRKQPRRDHGQFDQVSRLRDGTPLDKVKVARVIARGAVDLEVLDLRSRVDELIDFIRCSN
jgi:hypothetical protein